MRLLSDTEIAETINDTAGFDILTDRQVEGLRKRSPWKLGRNSKVSPLLLVAWLKTTLDQGEIMHVAGKTTAERKLDASGRSNDIERILGHIPDVEDPERKESCRCDLPAYLRTYHGETFCLPFSSRHIAMLQRLQSAMMGFSAWMLETAFRAFGKTSLAEGAAMWAINYGHRKYVPIIGPDEAHAAKVAASIQTEYESNDVVCADFPEICWAIRALEGKFQRCASQSYRGKLTCVEWNSKTLVFPMIEGSPAAGSIIESRGYTGRIRGLRHKRADGAVLRPDFAIFEDPQTEATAKSPSKCDNLLEILINAVLGLSGHTKRISVVVPATIIQQGDAIDQLATDKERFGAWVHNNTPLMSSLPDKMDLWLGKYAEMRRAFDPELPGDQERAQAASNEIYKDNREEMDTGAEATWAECFDDTEISAIQHGMNILIDRGEEYFASECQGQPIDARSQGIFELDQDVIARRVNGLPRLRVPATSQVLTAFVDVAHQRLDWIVVAWGPDFTGHVAAYGEWPENKKPLWDTRYQSLSQGMLAGLTDCVNHINSLVVTRDDGEVLPLDRVLIDCGDPETRGEVFTICAGKRFGCNVLPSRGRAHHKFRMPSDKKVRSFVNAYLDVWKGSGRVVIHDACVWRERIQKGLMSPEGTPGAIRIWGSERERHTKLAEQLCGERLIEKLVGETGEIYKWYVVPGVGNHKLDCLVGSAVAAAIEGIRFVGQAPAVRRKRRKRGGMKVIDI